MVSEQFILFVNWRVAYCWICITVGTSVLGLTSVDSLLSYETFVFSSDRSIHGTTKLVSYFAVLNYCLVSQTEKEMVGMPFLRSHLSSAYCRVVFLFSAVTDSAHSLGLLVLCKAGVADQSTPASLPYICLLFSNVYPSACV